MRERYEGMRKFAFFPSNRPPGERTVFAVIYWFFTLPSSMACGGTYLAVAGMKEEWVELPIHIEALSRSRERELEGSAWEAVWL